MDADAYLMALRRFIDRRGRPAELWSVRGKHFTGGERELWEAFASMAPALQEQLACQQIKFCFNPPAAPHFAGVWEREVCSVKSALYTCVGAQPVPEEVEAILISMPLGYGSSDITDINHCDPKESAHGAA